MVSFVASFHDDRGRPGTGAPHVESASPLDLDDAVELPLSPRRSASTSTTAGAKQYREQDSQPYERQASQLSASDEVLVAVTKVARGGYQAHHPNGLFLPLLGVANGERSSENAA